MTMTIIRIYCYVLRYVLKPATSKNFTKKYKYYLTIDVSKYVYVVTLLSWVRRAYRRAVEDELRGPDARLVLGGEADGGGQQSRAQGGGGARARPLRPRQPHHAHAQRGPAPLRLHAAVRHAAARQLERTRCYSLLYYTLLYSIGHSCYIIPQPDFTTKQ